MAPDAAFSVTGAIAGLAASIGVGLIFLGAGVTKLRHRDLLPGVVANYRLLPDALVAPVAALLPWIELAIGATLILGLRPLPVLLGMALLVLFAGAMAVNLQRGRAHIHCGCGRPELSQTLSWSLVLRNLLLAAALMLRLPLGSELAAIDLVTAVGAGASLWLLTTLLGAIGAIATSPLAQSQGHAHPHNHHHHHDHGK